MAPLRRRDPRSRWDMHFGPSMTPMVDVVLVILIFFMAAAALIGPEKLLEVMVPAKVSPQAGDPFALGPATLTLTLEAASDGVRISGAGLRDARLEELSPHAHGLVQRLGSENLTVVVEAGRGVSYQDVAAACDACLGAGIRKVGVR